MQKHDVVIIGGGPSGAVAGTYLARAGVDVAIVERERFPRFHIGESLLPATMPIFKEIDFYKTLSAGKYIEKYGARFVDYETDEEVYFGFAEGWNPDIPMAFEVERSQFDLDLLEHAKKSGVTVYQPERVKTIFEDNDQIRLTTSTRELSCKYMIDSTGRDSMLGKSKQVRTANKGLNNFAVFAHFTGVERYNGKDEGDITIGLLPNRSWIWIIPFKGETTSVGLVASSVDVPQGTDLSEFLHQQLQRSPRVAKMMANAERTMEVTTIANYSQGCSHLYGPRWMMSGDAAFFLDPIFSSGVHVGCTSGKLAAQTLIKALKDNTLMTDKNLGADYEQEFRKGVSRFRNLIMLFYGGRFVPQMKQTLIRENMRKGFTSAVAGDVWDDSNFLFQKSVL